MKLQVSLEYMNMLIFLSAILILLIVGGYLSTAKSILAKEEKEARNVLQKVINEIELASYVGPGYERIFYLPYSINGLKYNITVSNYTVRLTLKNGKVWIETIDIEEVKGYFHPGKNLIKNVKGMIYGT